MEIYECCVVNDQESKEKKTERKTTYIALQFVGSEQWQLTDLSDVIRDSGLLISTEIAVAIHKLKNSNRFMSS